METEEEAVLVEGDAAEVGDVAGVEADEVAAMLQGLLTTRERKSRDNAKKPTNHRAQIIIAKHSETRRWQEVGLQGKHSNHSYE